MLDRQCNREGDYVHSSFWLKQTKNNQQPELIEPIWSLLQEANEETLARVLVLLQSLYTNLCNV